jgi:dipeptide/tripeptide permease
MHNLLTAVWLVLGIASLACAAYFLFRKTGDVRLKGLLPLGLLLTGFGFIFYGLFRENWPFALLGWLMPVGFLISAISMMKLR